MNKTPEYLTQQFVTKLGKMMSLRPIVIFSRTKNFICPLDLCNLVDFEILNLTDKFQTASKILLFVMNFFY